MLCLWCCRLCFRFDTTSSSAEDLPLTVHRGIDDLHAAIGAASASPELTTILGSCESSVKTIGGGTLGLR